MKSIGFRSSIISRWEGADLIIPNGDLLNAHLINWTLGGSKMRVDIMLRIDYATDLETTRNILDKALNSVEEVLKVPAPTVYFYAFNNNTVEVKVSFWVFDYKESTAIKSKVVKAIQIVFRENDIIIPIPQQELKVDIVAINKEPENKGRNDSDRDHDV